MVDYSDNKTTITEVKIRAHKKALEYQYFTSLAMGIIMAIAGFYIDSTGYKIAGGFLIVIGLYRTVRYLLVPKDKLKLLIAINPSEIRISKDVNMEKKDIVFNTRDIYNVELKVDYDKGSKLNIYYKTDISNENSVVLDIFQVNIDSFVFEKKLKLLIGTTNEERVRILEAWDNKE